ncbi:unnamed protein product [Linum trigynum]|uniref:Uncharacterized protein n=1 Tax=Linum trigynum TaxID=586398 RepID=A0AAV2E7Q4_9ROSI
MATFVPPSSELRWVHSICGVVVKGCWGNLLKPKIDTNLTAIRLREVLLQLSAYSYSPCLAWELFGGLSRTFRIISTPYNPHGL